MNGLTSFLVAFSFPWYGGKTKCGIRSHKKHKVEKIDLSVLLFQVMKEPISSLTNYFMVSVFGWPDPNTGLDQSEHALYTCYFISTFDYNTYTGTLWSVVKSINV